MSALQLLEDATGVFTSSSDSYELCRNIVHSDFLSAATSGAQLVAIDHKGNLRTIASYGINYSIPENLSLWDDNPVAKALGSKSHGSFEHGSGFVTVFPFYKSLAPVGGLVLISGKKVAPLDDDPDILDAVSIVLKSENYIVVTAMDGQEGVEKFKSEKPDLILCDMMMERIDAGAKVAEAIRQEDKNIPIYLLSSIGSVTDINTDINKKGFNGVLQKPVDPSNLKAEIKKALNK